MYRIDLDYKTARATASFLRWCEMWCEEFHNLDTEDKEKISELQTTLDQMCRTDPDV